MAEKRMFTQKIIDSDAFLDMPLSTQALYFHLNMRADDDGFINNPKKIQRMVGASEDDCKLLIMKRFVIAFDSGVIVIKHWKIHNYIRNDRYKPTVYEKEKGQLIEKGNKAYSEILVNIPLGIPNDNQMDTQVRLGKDSLGKVRSVEVSANGYGIDTDLSTEDDELSTDNEQNTFELMGGTLGKNVILLTPAQDEELLEKLGFHAYNHYMDKLSTFIIEKGAKVSNHYATILKWAREDAMI